MRLCLSLLVSVCASAVSLAACGGSDFSGIQGQDGGGDSASNDAGSGVDGDSGNGSQDGSSGDSGSTDGGGGDAISVLDGGSDGSVCPSGLDCVASAPPGWQGPVDFGAGNPAPACPSGTSGVLDGHQGLNAPNAQCSTCTCADPSGVTCSDPTVRFFSDQGCATACGEAKATASCSQASLLCAAATSISREVFSTPSGGSCAPSTEVPTLPMISWSTNGIGCQRQGPIVSCGPNEVCAHGPTATFNLCIYQSGDQACPSGPYTNKHVFFQKFDDTRSCSDCACGSPQVDCSGGAVTLSPNTNCSNGIQSSVPASCGVDGILATDPVYVQLVTPPTPSGTCPPSGGQPTGSATPASPVTVCCQ
jgi:hypothetical protein